MLAKLIEFSLENRFLILALTFLMAVAGVNSALLLPIDAVPDMTNVQVAVITDAGSLSPVEVERYVTYPVEATMGGLPNVEELRSVSKFGISVVTIVFEEGTDICVVYVPILMLQGTEGKLFRPMALTVLFALGGSLILSMTLMPALASLSLPRRMTDKDVLLVRWIKWIYRAVVSKAISNPLTTTAAALFVFAASIPVALNLGAEFMPRLEEGDLLVEAVRLPSASLEGAIDLSTAIERELIAFPEVKTAFCKTGRPEIANDVMGVHQTDV